MTAGGSHLHDQPPGFVQRHDLMVVIVALALLAAGGLGYRSLTQPPTTPVARSGLSFIRPGSWLPPVAVPRAPPRLALDQAVGGGSAGRAEHHVMYTSPVDPLIRLEVRITERPAYSNVRGALGFERHSRYGELHWSDSAKLVAIGEVDWLRTRFLYAFKSRKDDSPRVATGIEYATLNGKLMYVVTVHGSSADAEQLADRIAPTLRVDRTAPEAGVTGKEPPLARRTPVAAAIGSLSNALPSVVMVVAVDRVNGKLQPVSGASGTIVSETGAVLTNFHVIHDREGDRLHDLFVIGRYRSVHREPEFVCAGRPEHSLRDPGLDLALIQCELDMNGHPWSPSGWPAVAVREDPIVLGEQIWVVSYPDVGGGNIDVSAGTVKGFSGEEGGDGDAFIRTDATVTHGSSGGAAVDEHGKLVGIPSAYRLRKLMPAGHVVGKVGLVRPAKWAGNLIERARKGWKPAPGDNVVTTGDRPSPLHKAPPSGGVVVGSKVVDTANDKPIAGAVVIVFKPGVAAKSIEMSDLDEQALTWAQTNARGEFTFPERIPRGQNYTVAVMAKAYKPLSADGILVLDAHSPELFNPWGEIRLERK